MKLTKHILPALALICATLASLPDRAAAEDELPGIGVQPASYFFTGKPYDEDLSAYAFNYRTYDPQITRWTTADPMGFPDGANDHYYAPVPLQEIDVLGALAHHIFGDQRHVVRFTVAVIDPNNSVSDYRIDKWRRGMNERWSVQGTDRSNGQSLSFSIQATISRVGNMSEADALASYDNIIYPMENGYRSRVIGGRIGRWAGDADGWVAAHEAGHFMGAGDKYTNNSSGGSTPDPGWEETLMGDRNATFGATRKDGNLVLETGFNQTVHLFE